MDYRPVFLSCHCGEPATRIEEVGLSSERELVIHWWCLSCKRVVYSTMPLSACWKACPRPLALPAPVLAIAESDRRLAEGFPSEDCGPASDEQFLKSMGVCFLRDGDA